MKFSVRASKVPTTIPHVHQLNLVFEGKLKPEMLLEKLSNTRRVVVVPYDDAGRKHDWTSEILEAFVSRLRKTDKPRNLRASILGCDNTLRAGGLYHLADSYARRTDVTARSKLR